jgi:hypothetical protein
MTTTPDVQTGKARPKSGNMRALRVPDDVWSDAHAAARVTGTTLSAVMRAALVEHTRQARAAGLL